MNLLTTVLRQRNSLLNVKENKLLNRPEHAIATVTSFFTALKFVKSMT